jgi:hypothetical protein
MTEMLDPHEITAEDTEDFDLGPACSIDKLEECEVCQ